MKLIKCAIVLLMFVFESVHCSRFNVSYEELDKCKEYDAISGYGYHTYFKLNDIHKQNSHGDIINVKLFILAGKDAHILLSATDSPKYDSPVYEIVLGAGGNTFAEIRRRRQSLPLKTIRTRKLLSAIEPLPIRLKISIDGVIDVSVPGSSALNLTAKDPAPFVVHYISFSSWGTTEAKFFYDCAPIDKDEQEEENILQAQYTPYESLRMSLFNFYDPNLMPLNLNEVFVNFELIKVSYDYKAAFLRTYAHLQTNWTDNRLKWDPKNFDNIQYLNILESGSLWLPQFKLLNGKGSFFKSFSINFTLTLQCNGLVVAESKNVWFETWCPTTNSHWPFDFVDCSIAIGLNNASIVPMITEPITNKSLDTPRKLINSEWNDVQITVDRNSESSYLPKVYEFSLNQLVFNIHLKRGPHFHKKVLIAPLTASCGLLIISLFTCGYLRAALNILSILITHIMYILLAEYVPTAVVTPKIVLFYDYTLMLATLSLLLSILNHWLRKNEQIQRFSNSILQLPWLRIIFYLDGGQSVDIIGYQKVDESAPADLGVLLDRGALLIHIATILIISCSWHF